MSATAKTPAYLTFAAALAQRFTAAGLTLTAPVEGAPDGMPGPKGWVMFQTQNGDKVYCNRTLNSAPTVVHTTVPIEQIPGELIVEDLRGRVGKIEASVTPSVEGIASLLIPVIARRVASGQKIRETRRGKAGDRQDASGTASPALTWSQAVAPAVETAEESGEHGALTQESIAGEDVGAVEALGLRA